MNSGFIKFLGPYYMLLITKRRKIGVICGHVVYSVCKSEMIPVPHSSVQFSMDYSKNEKRSFVNSACTNCNMYMVLVRRHMTIVRLYLDEELCHHLIFLYFPNKINVGLIVCVSVFFIFNVDKFVDKFALCGGNFCYYFLLLHPSLFNDWHWIPKF